MKWQWISIFPCQEDPLLLLHFGAIQNFLRNKTVQNSTIVSADARKKSHSVLIAPQAELCLLQGRIVATRACGRVESALQSARFCGMKQVEGDMALDMVIID